MAGIKKYVIPPPAFPIPPVKALAVPTIFLSKKPVDQTWQGTKLPPRIPMKKRRASKPLTVVTAPARDVGMAPARRQAAKVYLGPKRSHEGPATNRTSRLYKLQIDIEPIAQGRTRTWQSGL